MSNYVTQVMITFIAVDFFELVDLEQYDLPLDILSLHPDKVLYKFTKSFEWNKFIHSWMCAWLFNSPRRFWFLSLSTGFGFLVWFLNKISPISNVSVSEWWSVCLRHFAHIGKHHSSTIMSPVKVCGPSRRSRGCHSGQGGHGAQDYQVQSGQSTPPPLTIKKKKMNSCCWFSIWI